MLELVGGAPARAGGETTSPYLRTRRGRGRGGVRAHPHIGPSRCATKPNREPTLSPSKLNGGADAFIDLTGHENDRRRSVVDLRSLARWRRRLGRRRFAMFTGGLVDAEDAFADFDDY